MANRFQRVLLILAALIVLPSVHSQTVNTTDSVNDLDREVFSLGLFAGFINVGDFSGELGFGLTGTFLASEDFFLQYNYLQADIPVSSGEKNNPSNFFEGDDRTFVHYDLLLGYNLFQGEMYPSEGVANLSTFYLVGGIGDTQFGGEESFTYTAGLGYQVALTRRWIWHVDYRAYFYESSLIRGVESTTQNSQFTSGISFTF
jgi:outer membrane beta-barrel protein